MVKESPCIIIYNIIVYLQPIGTASVAVILIAFGVIIFDETSIILYLIDMTIFTIYIILFVQHFSILF